MIFLFWRIALYSGLIVRRSTDIRSGAARMAHRAICVLLCSQLNPKFPIISYSKATQNVRISFKQQIKLCKKILQWVAKQKQYVSPKILVSTYKSTECYQPEGQHRYFCCYKNLKFHKIYISIRNLFLHSMKSS